MCKHEHEQVNMIESFLEYLVDDERILEEYFLTHGKKISCGRIFCHLYMDE
jgi:hypothetical protein